MTDKRKIAGWIISCLLSLTLFSPAYAISSEEARNIQAKAAMSMEKLKVNMEAGKDVSHIVPMMKNVKLLGDKGKFKGEIKGINSAAVDGVPTMDRDGNFYFISTVQYNKTHRFSTI